MASKENVLFIAETNEWKITYRNAKGDESIRDTVASIEHMDSGESLKVFQGLVSEAPNKRRAAVSLLCDVMASALVNLKDWQGKGNKKTGQLDNNLKEEFRKAEDSFFGQFMDKAHPLHKTYIGRLPKLDERGNGIEGEDGKENIRARHNHFVTATRKDPSYSGAKNLVLSYFAFVGNLPYNEKDGSMVPPEAMRVMVANAKDVIPKDTSWATRFTELVRELTVPEEGKAPAIADDRLAALTQDCRRALDELERLSRVAAERATTKHQHTGDVAAAAAKATAGARRVKAEEPAPM